MTILGIETSCDETSAAIIQNGTVKANLIYTQKIHEQYGGVIPELSGRAHLQKISPLVKTALKNASVSMEEIDVVAATAGPGLIGSLIVGYNFAQGLALSLDVPFVPVNHIEGHIYSGFLMESKPEFPALILVVSGGHTLLLKVESHTSYTVLGTTIDDAVGEAFDKVSKLLGLGYPGGPKIQQAADAGEAGDIRFPIADVSGDYNFSYSGLKTSVLRYMQKTYGQRDATASEINNVAYAFQDSAISALTKKIEKALSEESYKSISAAGGVAANKLLRERLAEIAVKFNLPLVMPAFEYCTDNGAMIASRAGYLLESGIENFGIEEPFPSFKSAFLNSVSQNRAVQFGG